MRDCTSILVLRWPRRGFFFQLGHGLWGIRLTFFSLRKVIIWRNLNPHGHEGIVHVLENTCQAVSTWRHCHQSTVCRSIFVDQWFTLNFAATPLLSTEQFDLLKRSAVVTSIARLETSKPSRTHGCQGSAYGYGWGSERESAKDDENRVGTWPNLRTGPWSHQFAPLGKVVIQYNAISQFCLLRGQKES